MITAGTAETSDDGDCDTTPAAESTLVAVAVDSTAAHGSGGEPGLAAPAAPTPARVDPGAESERDAEDESAHMSAAATEGRTPADRRDDDSSDSDDEDDHVFPQQHREQQREQERMTHHRAQQEQQLQNAQSLHNKQPQVPQHYIMHLYWPSPFFLLLISKSFR